MSGVAHLNLQNPQFYKYQYFCSRLIWRRGYHNWYNAASNRWVKIEGVYDQLINLRKKINHERNIKKHKGVPYKALYRG